MADRLFCNHGHRLYRHNVCADGRCKECRTIAVRKYDEKRRHHPEQIKRQRGRFSLRDSLARINRAITRELAQYNYHGKNDADYVAIGKWLEKRGKDWNAVRELNVKIKEACSN